MKEKFLTAMITINNLGNNNSEEIESSVKCQEVENYSYFFSTIKRSYAYQ